MLEPRQEPAGDVGDLTLPKRTGVSGSRDARIAEESLGGLPGALLTVGADAALRVTQFGAHVYSCQLGGTDIFYMSPLSINDGTKPLRGGSPLVGPWFRAGPDGILHGVLRTAEYNIKDCTMNGALARITFTMQPNELTERFMSGCAVEVSVALGPRYTTTEVIIDNTNGKSDIKGAVFGFHDYFAQQNALQTRISGLNGRFRDDMAKPPVELLERRDLFSIERGGETSRFFLDPVREVALQDPLSGRKIRLTANDLPRAYLWNPCGRDNMADLPPAEHSKFVCVELMSAETDIPMGTARVFSRTVSMD